MKLPVSHKNAYILSGVSVALAIAVFIALWHFSPPALPQKDFVDELTKGLPIEVEAQDELDIVFVGDIMLSRNVGGRMYKSEDWTLPFANIAEITAGADIAFGNLESPFFNEGGMVTEGLSFKSEPQAIDGLVRAGFDVLSTANNHSFDRGSDGIAYTRDWLAGHNILPVGTGTTTAQAWEPAVVTLKDTTIAFLAATYFSRPPYIADLDAQKLAEQVEKLRGQGAQIIIVSMHAGTEYTHQPTAEQETFARAAIDAGADVVVGHHPHWVQPVELYKGGVIFYSLGNFVFDQEWSQKTKEGLMVRLHIRNRRLESASLLPVIIQNYCCARLADAQEATRILSYINASSTYLFTPIR